MGASRAALLGGWLHVCWAATRLSELAPSPEDAAPNSIALPAAGGSMADGKTTGRARMDVGEVAPLRRAAAIHSGALQPRAAATRAYLGLARTYVPRNRASIDFDQDETEGDGGRRTARHQSGGGGV